MLNISVLKAEGGRDVAKGVVKTTAGNMIKPTHILHLHLDDSIAKFR